MFWIWKSLYVISRQTGLSGLPLCRIGRNFIYNKYLDTNGVNVDDFVRIGTAHRNSCGSYIRVGTDLHVSRDVDIDFSGGLSIGNRVTVSEGAKLFTHTHAIDGSEVDWRPNIIEFSSLIVEDDVWIGAGAIILPSVGCIGQGAVVAAGSVVTKDVAPFSVVGGNPARALRMRRIDSLRREGGDALSK